MKKRTWNDIAQAQKISQTLTLEQCVKASETKKSHNARGSKMSIEQALKQAQEQDRLLGAWVGMQSRYKEGLAEVFLQPRNRTLSRKNQEALKALQDREVYIISLIAEYINLATGEESQPDLKPGAEVKKLLARSIRAAGSSKEQLGMLSVHVADDQLLALIRAADSALRELVPALQKYSHRRQSTKRKRKRPQENVLLDFICRLGAQFEAAGLKITTSQTGSFGKFLGVVMSTVHPEGTGIDIKTRIKEAQALLNEDRQRYLLIPSFGSMLAYASSLSARTATKKDAKTS